MKKVKDLLKVEKNKKTEIIGLVLFFISLAGTLLLYFVLDKYLYKELDWHWVAIIISNVFILPFIADFLTSDVVSDFGKSIESYFASLLIKPLAVKNYKKFLFPNRCDEYLGSQKKVKIDLISPPDGKDTYSLLTRIKEYVLFNYKTKLYCDENAFEIGNSKNIILSLIGDIDIEERNQREIERQERLRRMRPVDPLITTEIGDYVVLIGAYGTESFINEKEALEEIKDYYKNELSKFQPNLNFKFTNLSLN